VVKHLLTINGGQGTAQSEVADLTYGEPGSIKYLGSNMLELHSTVRKNLNVIIGVGSGTTIDYVEFFQGADDGIEFFGGTVNTSNLISIGNEDDQFDWTEGWSGTNTNWYGKLGFGKGNRGIG
jgi:hypothetical protein